jgi:hypothetical protein
MQRQPYSTITDEHGDWLKSSYSNAGGSCVEVIVSVRHRKIRDTKNRRGGLLEVTKPAWIALLATLRASESAE